MCNKFNGSGAVIFVSGSLTKFQRPLPVSMSMQILSDMLVTYTPQHALRHVDYRASDIHDVDGGLFSRSDESVSPIDRQIYIDLDLCHFDFGIDFQMSVWRSVYYSKQFQNCLHSFSGVLERQQLPSFSSHSDANGAEQNVPEKMETRLPKLSFPIFVIN